VTFYSPLDPRIAFSSRANFGQPSAEMGGTWVGEKHASDHAILVTLGFQLLNGQNPEMQPSELVEYADRRGSQMTVRLRGD